MTDSTNASASLYVTVSTSLGTLALPSNTSSLTLSVGYDSFSGATFSFTGTMANVNAALNAMTITGGGTKGTATVAIAVTPAVSGVYYLPATQHYYEYVANNNITWTGAQTAANSFSFDGQEGYLATDTSSTINNFLNTDLGSAAYDVWAGGQATSSSSGGLNYSADGVVNADRIWYWGGANVSSAPGAVPYGGPLAGQAFTACANYDGNCAFMQTAQFGLFYYNPAAIGAGAWYYANASDQEPNNTGDVESYLSINYEPGGTSSSTGKWNDFNNTASTTGYIVEFGNLPTGATSWTGSASASSQMTMTTVPGAPTGVTATAGAPGSGQLAVSWTAPNDAGGAAITAYAVTASPEVGGTTLGCTTMGPTTCTVGGLNPNTGYAFTVTAANAVGVGAGTTSASTTSPAGVPGTPTGLTATPAGAGSDQIAVSWTAPAGNGATISGYTVTATSASAPTVTCSATSASGCVLNNLAPASTYAIALTAANAVGTSGAATASATAPAATVPSAPSGVGGVAGAAGSGQVVVSWSAPVSTGGSAIVGYNVTASPQVGGQTATCSTGGALSCTIEGLDPVTAYVFSVTAINIAGVGASASGSGMSPTAAPGAPSGVMVTAGGAGSGQLAVGWTAPSDNGAAISGYAVTATAVGAPTVRCTASSGSGCTLAGLQASTAYQISVVASNVVGSGLAASVTFTAPAPAAPGAPLLPSATPGNSGSGAVSVSWFAPADDGGAAITGYTVVASSQADGSTSACSTTGSLSCQITGLTSGTSYTFTVTATNSAGAGPGVSTSALATATAPGVPTGLTASPGATGSAEITLAWSAPVSDGGSAITGYTVTAVPQVGGVTPTCSTSGALTCTITGLNPGDTYLFTVLAVNEIAGGASASILQSAPDDLPGAPSGVGGVTGAAGSGQVVVSWSAPVSTGGSAIVGYTVTATAVGDPVTHSCFSVALSCAVTDLTLGSTYTFNVVAANSAGSGPAATIALTAGAITAPGSVTLTPATVHTGVTISARGVVSLPLACPLQSDGCSAVGWLSAIVAHKRVVLVRVRRTRLAPGATARQSDKIAPSIRRLLRAHGIVRVRAKLTMTSQLTGRKTLTSVQRIWVNVAAIGHKRLA